MKQIFVLAGISVASGINCPVGKWNGEFQQLAGNFTGLTSTTHAPTINAAAYTDLRSGSRYAEKHEAKSHRTKIAPVKDAVPTLENAELGLHVNVHTRSGTVLNEFCVQVPSNIMPNSFFLNCVDGEDNGKNFHSVIHNRSKATLSHQFK